MKAKTFDRLFDEGKDLTEYLDFAKARRPNRERRAGTDSPPRGHGHRAVMALLVLALGVFTLVLTL